VWHHPWREKATDLVGESVDSRLPGRIVDAHAAHVVHRQVALDAADLHQQ
jgi:hypothetical protein